MAYVGPYQVHARLQWADGMRVEVYGMAEDRAQYLKLLAAIMTIRRLIPNRLRPNERRSCQGSY